MSCHSEEEKQGQCYENSESQIETESEKECCCDSCHCSDCLCNEDSELFSDTEDGTTSETEDDTSNDECIDNDDKHCILQGRWLYDDSNSIDEMIEALQREIALLTDLKNNGWVLQEKVMDDHAYLVKVDESE